jgi:hypothetical protein
VSTYPTSSTDNTFFITAMITKGNENNANEIWKLRHLPTTAVHEIRL